MSKSLNRVELLGNLTEVPSMRYMQDGTGVVTISLATNESWFDRTTQEKRERADFHRLVFFGKLAEIINQYGSKGMKVYVEGKLQTRSWETDKGEKRYMTEVKVGSLILLGGKRDEFHDDVKDAVGGEAPEDQNPSEDNRTSEDISDDIPF